MRCTTGREVVYEEGELGGGSEGVGGLRSKVMYWHVLWREIAS